MHDFDTIDIKILSTLQRDANTTIKDIADKVGLSTNACWKRIKSFEDKGVIKGRVTLINARSMGFNLIAFVNIKAAEHSEEWNETFKKAVLSIPQVIEFYRLSGSVDYIIKVLLPNIEGFEIFYKLLTSKVKIVEVSTSFAVSEFRNTSAVPLPLPLNATGSAA
ncbi:Lrp/AsnC family transcriptional regulator [Stakelama sp. CBK3Z-3]|uniref:Lrp/AsnC family transcriptional regulator n=1 Tax=Stakelama flava TaxID=2860338 RepID=A0ABS6XPM4_9SPHN|nr:Lrp/AsnC family transcriptional regulator [Stakelama flava]MBW4332169.1 Lrp/AsnC family transcriptional regulator [Stakelama flava]